MDILKKMFQAKSEDDGQETSSTSKDEFRKPQWFDEAETDDELYDDDRKFAFQVFTNPLELQRHFERQMQRVLESISDLEDGDIPMEKDLKEDFLKPGFESKFFNEFEQRQRGFDTDLDGEIYADQLHSLLQRLSPEEKLLHEQQKQRQRQGEESMPSNILPSNRKPLRRLFTQPKLTDEEIIMGRIHGTLALDSNGETKPNLARPPRLPPNGKSEALTPLGPRSGMTPFGGVLGGGYQGPKMFSQSIMTKTVRKPDGSYETTKVTQDSSGNKTTTITRMVDGKQEVVSTHNGTAAPSTGNGSKQVIGLGEQLHKQQQQSQQYTSDRNLFVTKEGYAMPRNLW